MMQILILFTVFVMIESLTFYESREKLPLNDEEIIKFVEKMTKLEDFEKIERLATGTSNTNLDASTITVQKIMDKIHGLSYVYYFNFKRSIVIYMKTKLAIYCTIAINLITASENAERFYEQEKIFKSIKFQTHDYCAASLLMNFGSIDISIFQTIFFLQTINFEQMTLNDLKNKLLGFIKGIKHSENGEDIIIPSYISIPDIIIDNNEMFTELSKIREQINNYSKIFCSSIKPPFINTDVVFKNQIYNDKDQFIDHVFQKAECEITFDTIEDDLKTQRDRIKDWSCHSIENKILYGFENYVFDIQEWVQNIEPDSGKIWRSVQDTLCTGSKQKNEAKSKDLMLSTEIKTRDMFSLATLKTKLELNNYFLNVMLYSNITTDVMVYVSLQEGFKELQGIKHFFFERCSTKTYFTLLEINVMRSRLFMYKSYFDSFIDQILEKLQIHVTRHKRNELLEAFNERVDQVIYILEYSNDMIWKIYCVATCTNIERELNNIQHNFPEVKPKEHELIKYYFHDPILTIHKLYHLI